MRNWFRPANEFDVNKLMDDIEKTVDPFKSRQFRQSYVGGGVWVRGTADEFMLSVYMHAARWHRTAIRSGATGKIMPSSPSVAVPG